MSIFQKITEWEDRQSPVITVLWEAGTVLTFAALFWAVLITFA